MLPLLALSMSDIGGTLLWSKLKGKKVATQILIFKALNFLISLQVVPMPLILTGFYQTLQDISEMSRVRLAVPSFLL